MIFLESIHEFFLVIRDDPSLRKRYAEVEREHIFEIDRTIFSVRYVPFVSALASASLCVVCGRPARHVCVIRIVTIKECLEVPLHPHPFAIDVGKRRRPSIREWAKEQLMHHQPLCLFPDCVRPPKNANFSPA